ncbi:MAG: TRAP transporter small permease [Peptococcaceae bacterium]|nr:TRAP transporter small permease [Peptococcaceae bacterium]MDH7525389.1 TRAP transporter small permease [Peptococcaceae bacterium]
MLMVFTIVPDTLGRKYFAHPLQGTLEFNEMLMVIVIFVGLAWTQSERGHVCVEVFTSRMKAKTARIVGCTVWFLCFLFFALITAASVVEACRSIALQETVWGIAKLPVWPVKIILALGCFLLSFQFLLDVIADAACLNVQKGK